MHINAKAIVLDLDGTVLNSKHQVSSLTKETLKKIADKGIKIVLASARPIHSVLNIANHIGLSRLPMIGGNGAIIASDRNNILYRNSIAKEDLQKIIPIFKKYIYNKNQNDYVTIHFYSGFDWLVPVHNETVEYEIRAIGFNPDFTGEEVFERSVFEKVMCVTDPAFTPALYTEIKKACPALEIVRSKPSALEITAPGVSKLTGVINYAKIYQLELSDFIAMGDGDNDEQILAHCGYGVAMGNGSELAKKSAKEITLSNDEDGVAVFLKNYFAIN